MARDDFERVLCGPGARGLYESNYLKANDPRGGKDARGRPLRANARLVIDRRRRQGKLKASRTIQPGDEILDRLPGRGQIRQSDVAAAVPQPADYGSALYIDRSDPTLANNDVWNNPDVLGTFFPSYQPTSAEAEYTGVSGNLSTNPMLCDPEGQDFAPRADSPCATASETGSFIGALADCQAQVQQRRQVGDPLDIADIHGASQFRVDRQGGEDDDEFGGALGDGGFVHRYLGDEIIFLPELADAAIGLGRLVDSTQITPGRCPDGGGIEARGDAFSCGKVRVFRHEGLDCLGSRGARIFQGGQMNALRQREQKLCHFPDVFVPHALVRNLYFVQ